jgi:hypothetical protein
MTNPGKLVIIAMFAVATVAAAASTWYHYRTVHRSQEFWGTTSAVLISQAPQVRLMRVGERSEAAPDEGADSDAETPPTVEFAGQLWKVVAVKEPETVPGMSILRRALILDSSFDWAAPSPADEPKWQYALEFNDGRNWATVLFDFESRRTALSGGTKTVALAPDSAKAIREILDEQFGDSDAPGDSAAPAAGQESAQESSETPAEKPEPAATP